jgi:hypothetical protein
MIKASRIGALIGLMMVACGAWAQSQPPSPSTVKAAEQQQHHPGESDDGASPKKNYADAPPISAVVSPTINAEHAQDSHRDERDNKSSNTNYVEIIGSVITVISTIVIAIFTWRLSNSTKNLWEETKASGQTARDAADAASALAAAARDQAALMEAQRGVMQLTLEATQKAANAAELSARAAIGVELPKLILVSLDFPTNGTRTLAEKIQSPYINIVMKNYGRTPAFITSHCIAIHRGESLPAEPRYPQIANEGADAVAEGGKEFKTVDVRILDPIPSEMIDAIRKGDLSFWVYGFVRYRDFLGDSHESKFCRAFMRIFVEGESDDNRERYIFVDWDENKKYTESH